MPPYMIRSGAALKLRALFLCCLTLDSQVSALTDAVRLCHSLTGKDVLSVAMKYSQQILTYG